MMNMKMCIFLCFCCFTGAISQQEVPDFFILALTWPPGFCFRGDCRTDLIPIQEEFKIKALLPQLWLTSQRGRGYLRKSKEAFDYASLSQGVRTRLSRYWINIKEATKTENERLLRHEWELHGSASGMSQEKYFSLACNLLESLSLLQRFQGIGISAGKGLIDVNELLDQYEKKFPDQNIVISCTAHYHPIGQVRFNISGLDHSFQSMKGTQTRNCPADGFVQLLGEEEH